MSDERAGRWSDSGFHNDLHFYNFLWFKSLFNLRSASNSVLMRTRLTIRNSTRRSPMNTIIIIRRFFSRGNGEHNCCSSQTTPRNNKIDQTNRKNKSR